MDEFVDNAAMIFVMCVISYSERGRERREEVNEGYICMYQSFEQEG